MTRKQGIVAITMLVASVVAAPVWACKVAGPDKHVGMVQAVDTQSGTFTIMDAETNAPITFQASAKLIKQVEQAQGQVMVSFEEEGPESLTAVDIHF